MARANDRDDRTFDGVYERYVDDVWRMCRRLGVADASVDDAVQDVFVVVHRRLGEFEGRSSLTTWLYGVALNIARNYRRRDRRIIESLPESVPDGGPSPAASAEQSEQLEMLDAILVSMDDIKREVFVLMEIEELSAPEAAEILELKLPTVYSRHRAARVQFHQLLRRRHLIEETEKKRCVG